MMKAEQFVDNLINNGYGPFIGVPCSNFKSILNYMNDKYCDQYIVVNNEGEAAAIAAGMYLCKKKPVVFCQNSGLANLYDPLTSLLSVYNISILLLVSWRGKEGIHDEVQHLEMGKITKKLLQLADVTVQDLSENNSLDFLQISQLNGIHCLLIDKFTFESDMSVEKSKIYSQGILSKEMVIEKTMSYIKDDDFVFSTNGFISRELNSLSQRKRNFYMLGSMGCVSGIALGVSMVKPNNTIVVFDGDGGLLMRLEAIVSIAKYSKGCFIHVVLDDGQYESTGCQATLSKDVDFPMLAKAVGYAYAVSILDVNGLESELTKSLKLQGAILIHVLIGKNSVIKPRITLGAKKMTENFRKEYQD